MTALVYIAESHPLMLHRLIEELGRETDYELVGFDTLAGAEQACQERPPDALLVSCRDSAAPALPLLRRLSESGVVVMALTEATEEVQRTEAIALLGPLAVATVPLQGLDLLPKLAAGLERQALARKLAHAEQELAKRDQALLVSKSSARRSDEELQAKHTVLETATARLVEAEKLAAVGRVVTGIAHDISNQLALVGYAEAIKSRVPADSELYEFADAIAMAQRRLATMVDQIRSFAAPVAAVGAETSGREPTSIAFAIDEALGILRYDKDVRARIIERNYRAHPLASLRREQFDQVVINLVSNAVEATSGGDTIHIELDEDQAAGMAVVTVRDTGQGMSADVLEHLGEPFFTTRGDRGSGLGVGICMSIAKAHGGAIMYVSEPGVGTTAKLRLPLLDAGAARAGQEERT